MMAFVKPTLLFNVVQRSFGTSAVCLAGHWNKDFKPAPYPKTEEERAAAAKKYGLMKEEYVPIPDDGDGAGDYPHLKPLSAEARDPHYPWDYPELRRDYNEVVHEHFFHYTEDRFNSDFRPRHSLPVMLSWFIGVMSGFYYLTYISKNTSFIPAMPRHVPTPGVTHYKYPSPKS